MADNNHHRYRNYIGGEWVDSESENWESNINPAAAEEILGIAPLSTEGDVDRAIEAAAQARSVWRETTSPQRGEILARVGGVIRDRQEEISTQITLEEGKSIREARLEVLKAARVFDYMAGAGRRLGGITRPSAYPRNLAYTVREPLGCVALITPWNFPVSIPAWKMAPALVAGNTIIFKPASYVPGSAELLVRVLDEAGFPPGVVNLVYGAGRQIGNQLLAHEQIRGVSFTGSNAVGSQVHQVCGQRGVPAQCEMGGKNPCIILDDADLELAVTALIGGAFGATGQRCTAMSRAIVQESIADQFLERLLARIETIQVGPGIDEANLMGPCVSESQMRTVLDYIDVGKQEGAHLVCGGSRLLDGEKAKGYFISPTVFDHVHPDMRIWQEEIFGPVLCVMRVPDFEAAIDAANDVRFGLTSVIYTRDLIRALRFTEEIEAGMAHVNSPWLGGEVHLPFGGMKDSAVGPHEMGDEAFDFFTQTKTVYISF